MQRPKKAGFFWQKLLKSLADVPVAQLDRVSASEAEGRGFNSRQARHLPTVLFA